MQRYMPRALDFRGPLHLDWIGTGCAVALAAMATLLAGAAPAWLATSTQPAEVLHSESSASGQGKTYLVQLFGQNIGVTNAKGYTLGVQWHPEWDIANAPFSMALFRSFGDAARKRRALRG